MSTPKCVYDYHQLRQVDPPLSPGPHLLPCEYIFVLGLPDPQNSGIQGFFEWRPHSTYEDNGGTVIKPSKPNLTKGRWHRVFDGAISVKWFGAIGDGVTDDTAALKNTLAAASSLGGGIVEVPGGIYQMSAQIVQPDKVKIVGKNIDVSILDFSNYTSQEPCILAEGSVAPTIALTADASISTTTLSVVPGHGLVAGDRVLVASNDNFHGNPFTIYGPPGEIATVVSTPDATTLTLSMPLYATYTTAKSATVQKCSLLSDVGLEDLTIRRKQADGTFGVTYRYAERVTIDRVRLQRMSYAMLSLDSVIDSVVNASTFEDSYYFKGGVCYGISVSNASARIRIHHSKMWRTRHAVAITKNFAPGTPRFVRIDHCHIEKPFIDDISYYAAACVDAHYPSEYISYDHNDILSNGQSAAIGLDGYYFSISGNRCVGGGIDVSGALDTLYNTNPTIDTLASGSIVGNHIAGMSGSVQVGVRTSADNISIVDNHIDMTGASSIAISVQAWGSGRQIQGGLCASNTLIGGQTTSIELDGVSHYKIASGFISAVTTGGGSKYGVICLDNGSSPCSYIDIDGVMIHDPGGNLGAGVGFVTQNGGGNCTYGRNPMYLPGANTVEYYDPNGMVVLPAKQQDSTATTLDDLKNDFNTLLHKLRAASVVTS